MWEILVIWNFIFNSCNLENLCNLARRRCKLPDDDMKISKHVGI